VAAAESEKVEVCAFARKKPPCRPLADHLAPERIMYPADRLAGKQVRRPTAGRTRVRADRHCRKGGQPDPWCAD
jgi:hypothetical protein